ncbi:MAG: GAF domain-containing sensor histidine kinase [Bacteroidota bacterium]|nr:MAG: GAF domain-containing sensor histidine kinase [Bacteroidota bacterium]
MRNTFSVLPETPISMNLDALLRREQLVKQICAQLNNFVDLRNTLTSIITQIKDLTRADAISIRLNEEGDFPYYVSEGFPQSFLDKENSLLEKNPELSAHECLCGQVATGKADPNKPYYTENGSFFTNSSTETTPQIEDNEQGFTIRNYCNACGYESIGLFPIKNRETIIGLLQINHKARDRFSPDIIEFIEMIGKQIGTAIENAILYEKLKKQNTDLEGSLNKLNNLQDQLITAKKNASLADMVASMAHEIYEPITQAHTSSLRALEITYSLAEKDTGYAREISTLASEGKKALKYIDEIRELIYSFKAIAIDQFQESRQLINLKVFIQNLLKVLKPSFKDVDIKFAIHCKDQLEFMCFSGALSQIFTQLLHNCYQHGFMGCKTGEVTIRCQVLPGDTIEISVSDNGHGLQPETKQKIFEPFFTTQRSLNSGLGLSMVKNLVEKTLRGTIEVNTAVDEGVEFRIRFPY